jgi:pSer/pThr/pTyr-binding forkhead associated (FHA) protein
MALLSVFDDGEESGETVRVRVPSFIIGRAEGHLAIPHDGGISGRHAEITRRHEDGRYRWSLRDLGSTNGTFVRTARAVLFDGQEFLIAGVRYRFEVPRSTTALRHAPQEIGSQPAPPGPVDSPAPGPQLVELGLEGPGPAFPLIDQETWIGRDPRQCILVVDRSLASARHAVIRTRRKGRWRIENAQSRDGLWLRIQEIEIAWTGQFQCGEQRFLFRIC